MSIIYCEKHDRKWDSDKLEECPLCENEPLNDEEEKRGPIGLRKPWQWVQPKNRAELIQRLLEAREYAVPDRERENLCSMAYKALRSATPIAWVWDYPDGHRSLRWRPDHDPSSSDVPSKVTPLYSAPSSGGDPQP